MIFVGHMSTYWLVEDDGLTSGPAPVLGLCVSTIETQITSSSNNGGLSRMRGDSDRVLEDH